MKPVWFVICFTLGVSLMVFSGYIPQSAKATGSPQGLETDAQDDLIRPAAIPRRGRVGPRFLHDPDAYVTESDPHPEDIATDGPESVDESYEGDASSVAEYSEYSDDTDGLTAETGGSVSAEVPPEIDGVAEPVAAGDEALEPMGDTAMEPGAVVDDAVASEPPVEEIPAGESEDAVEDWMPPLANAGEDRTTWVGWNEIVLDGSESEGVGLTYSWEQISGPLQLAIGDPTAAWTVATGVALDDAIGWAGVTYEFSLTVTDENGEQSTDRLRVKVAAAPKLVVRPSPEKRFDIRDGYRLAHYESWQTNLETYESTFEVLSQSGLTFTRVVGGPFEISSDETPKGIVYRITVFAPPDVASSWHEFLVDTEEKVPAILILGVNWE